MATTWAWINTLKLRHKLALIYTVAFTLILGISFLFIYSIAEANREEEFYKRLSDRTNTTYKIVVHVDQIDNNMMKLFDDNTINSLGDERILLFGENKQLVYTSTDSADIGYAQQVLQKLDDEETTFETSEDKYEILGVRFHSKGKTYYGVARAFDRFGKSKTHFLAVLLLGTFFTVTLLIIFLSVYLSRIVTRPITRLTGDVEQISPDDLSVRLAPSFGSDEIGFLANKFNELLDKVDNAFKFQAHYIHHLSHELKTPLAVMMANAERALAENEPGNLERSMQFQKNAIMELSHIINVLLDISKTEKMLTSVPAEVIRIDEIVFECLDEITYLNTDVRFDFTIDDQLNETGLTIAGNSRMIKMAVMNLVKNAVNYSGKENPAISIAAAGTAVQINIMNDGPVIAPDEQAKLFKHSFRGKNSAGLKGFGLGLVLAHRIVHIHKGTLAYTIDEQRNNCFTLLLPII